MSLVLHRSNNLQFEIRHIPFPMENELLIRVGYVCLSDTDFYHLSKGPAEFKGYSNPYVLGNHASGIVVKAGVGVGEIFQEGDRVVLQPGMSCNNCDNCLQGQHTHCPKFTFIGTEKAPGALCRFIAHPMRYCHKIPRTVGLDDATLCTSLASAIYACKKAGLNIYSTVVVIGTNFTAINLIMTCKLLGVKDVFVVDYSEYRLNFMRQFGAQYILKFRRHSDPQYLKEIIQEISGHSADITFEALGTSETLNIASAITKTGGQLIVVGPGPNEIKMSFSNVAYKEIDIKGIWTFGQSFQEALQLIKGGQVRIRDLKPLVLPLEYALEAFSNARAGLAGNDVVLIECFNEKAA